MMNRDIKGGRKWILIFFITFLLISASFVLWMWIGTTRPQSDDDPLTKWNGDVFSVSLPDFGPGRILVDVLKVVYEWKSRENIEAYLKNESGGKVAFERGSYHENHDGWHDGLIFDYFEISCIWQVLDKEDYVVVIEGVEKDSRDEVEINLVDMYDLTKDRLMDPNGTCIWHFEDHRPESIYLQATKTFPDGAVRNNIEARLLSGNDTCIEYCKGIFIDNDPPPEEDDDVEYDNDGDSDTGGGWLWSVLTDPSSQPTYDHYYLSHEFENCGAANLTLEVKGLRTNSKDEITVRATGGKDEMGRFQVKGNEDMIDNGYYIVISYFFIFLLIFIIIFSILFGLYRLFVFFRNQN